MKNKWGIERIAAWVGVLAVAIPLNAYIVIWLYHQDALPEQVKVINHKVDKIITYLRIVGDDTNKPADLTNQ